MGVVIHGLDSIEKELEKFYSPKAIEEAGKRAIKAGGHMLRNKVATDLDSVRDTGALAIGTNITNVERQGDELLANLYWRGEHRTLASINENGHFDKSGKWVKPRGIGKVDTQLALNREAYFNIIKRELDKR